MSNCENSMDSSDHFETDEDQDEFTITSSHAYVAAAVVACGMCHAKTEVICIHCETGTACGEPLTKFTLSDVSAIDAALARQLKSWPTFKRVAGPGEQGSDYANHCQHCGAVLDDLLLHSEPDEPFFDIPSAQPGLIKLTPLVGMIRLSGDEHFGLD